MLIVEQILVAVVVTISIIVLGVVKVKKYEAQAAQTASNAAVHADSGLGLSVQERKAMEAAERGVENPLYSDSGPLQCVAVYAAKSYLLRTS